MKKAILCCLLFAAAGFAAPKLKTGTYQLSGAYSKWGGDAYEGDVTIYPQGENYVVEWFQRHRKIKEGIGILCNDTLSVAYQDMQGRFWGVAIYKLKKDGELEGRWTNHSNHSQKPEYLIWIYP